jgi:hypothetical protein
MLTLAVRVYRETRKKHDFAFNVYAMRPVAALVVALLSRTRVTPNQMTLIGLGIFVAGVSVVAGDRTWVGGLVGVGILEASYCLDCVDGMLARYKNLASRAGHLLDFFADEAKAIMLAGALAVRAWRTGGVGWDARIWAAGDDRFLIAGVGGVACVALALSLTHFLRDPEISGRGGTVEAYYETVEARESGSTVGKVGAVVMGWLRWINHYPSHIWAWAILGRMEVFLWVWIALNALYLGRGWLGIVVRFGRR